MYFQKMFNFMRIFLALDFCTGDLVLHFFNATHKTQILKRKHKIGVAEAERSDILPGESPVSHSSMFLLHLPCVVNIFIHQIQASSL